MKNIYFILFFLNFFINAIYCIKISFVSWNVKDNSNFDDYDINIVSSLLQLRSTELKDLPDIYAITFQENCLNCNKGHLDRLATPFIKTIYSLKAAQYKLVSIVDTRQSSKCELMFCLSKASMHGTTLIMILAKEELIISNIFEINKNDCGSQWFGNDEKGVAIIGLNVKNTKYCFGGLHLDVNSVKTRQKCVVKAIETIKDNCDVIFIGGDFNTRPKSKDTPKPTFYEGGYNKSFFEEMKITDDLSGIKPYSGENNLLSHIFEKTGLKFLEPFSHPPDFIPTYSIKSSLECSFYPVCYKPSKYPSWTDRIIITSREKLKCTKYSAIETLAQLSDHLPVIADCQTY